MAFSSKILIGTNGCWASPKPTRALPWTTMVGSPEAIEEAAFQLCRKAMETIDMTKHQGQHPRMGATDVIPFVPTMDMDVAECTRG